MSNLPTIHGKVDPIVLGSWLWTFCGKETFYEHMVYYYCGATPVAEAWAAFLLTEDEFNVWCKAEEAHFQQQELETFEIEGELSW